METISSPKDLLEWILHPSDVVYSADYLDIPFLISGPVELSPPFTIWFGDEKSGRYHGMIYQYTSHEIRIQGIEHTDYFRDLRQKTHRHRNENKTVVHFHITANKQVSHRFEMNVSFTYDSITEPVRSVLKSQAIKTKRSDQVSDLSGPSNELEARVMFELHLWFNGFVDVEPLSDKIKRESIVEIARETHNWKLAVEASTIALKKWREKHRLKDSDISVEGKDKEWYVVPSSLRYKPGQYIICIKTPSLKQPVHAWIGDRKKGDLQNNLCGQMSRLSLGRD